MYLLYIEMHLVKIKKEKVDILELLNKFQDWGLSIFHWINDVVIHPVTSLGQAAIIGFIGSGGILGFLWLYTILNEKE